MKEQEEWIPFTEIDWNDKENNQFNIDTRDFHCGYRFVKEPHKDFNTIKNYPHFFHTEQEVKELIQRLFEESGSKKEWRMLSLISNDQRVLGWDLKYLRIYRTDLGLIVCNKQHLAIPKDIL